MSDASKSSVSASLAQEQPKIDKEGGRADQRSTKPSRYVPPHLRAAAVHHRSASETTHKAVVVLLVTPTEAASGSAYEAVQHVRSQYDAAFARWVPHVTLLPPFELPFASQASAAASRSTAEPAASDSVDAVTSSRSLIVEKLQASLAQQAPFNLTFADHGEFVHSRSTTLHLRPAHSSTSGRTEVERLQASIQAALSGIVKPERRKWNAHLTIGQASSRETLDVVRAQVKALSGREEPLAMRVESVALMGKKKQEVGAYEVWEVVKLGQKN